MPIVGTDTGGHTKQFECATASQRSLKDLRTKRRGQPVLALGHIVERKGQEATFEMFNDRLAVIKFADGVVLGYDPNELLLPTEIDEKGIAYFEVRPCKECEQLFPLTAEECSADKEPTHCPTCAVS
jgi:hypothetical protein